MASLVSNAPNKWRWYVYELRDPRCGSTFYVGKGKNQRMFKHVVDARYGVRSAKCEYIRAIENAGLEVIHEEVARFCDEREAYDHEADRIIVYGLENLTNVIPDGAGAYEAYKRAKARRVSQRVDITPQQVVVKSAKVIRHCLDLYEAGYERVLWGLPWVKTGAEMALRLRDRAGHEFFDHHVFGVPCPS